MSLVALAAAARATGAAASFAGAVASWLASRATRAMCTVAAPNPGRPGSAHPPGAWPRAGRGELWLVPVGLVERLAGEAGGGDAGEGGAVEDVVVRAAQRVIDGLAGGLGFGDLVVELGELAPGQQLPVDGRGSE